MTEPAVVPLASVPPISKEEAAGKIRVARLLTKNRCGAGLTVGVCWLDAGDTTPVWSFEEEDSTGPDELWFGPVEESYYVLSGRVRLTWTNGAFELGENDAAYLAPGWRYQLENIGDEQAMVVFGVYPGIDEGVPQVSAAPTSFTSTAGA